MNSIIYDDKIITPEGDRWNYYYDFLNKLDKRGCVKLALFCTKYVNNKSNHCIELVEKWLVDKNLVTKKELWDAAYLAADTAYLAADAINSYVAYCAYYTTDTDTDTDTAYDVASNSAFAANSVYSAASNAASAAAYTVNFITSNINIINKYLQILLRKTKQFQNNKILEQISKTDVDKLELVDWNMITDIIQEEYNTIHEFEYSDIFSRRCLIELLRREYA